MNVGNLGSFIHYSYSKHTLGVKLIRPGSHYIFGGEKVETRYKLVNFDEYCPKCKFFSLDDSDDPCNECLAQGGNENSHKPICFEEDKK